MKEMRDILKQLDDVGVKNKFLIWPELAQLPRILFEEERIHRLVIGGHPTGFACLIATDKRILLIDKVYFGLVVEDVPYHNVQAIHFTHGFMFGEISIRLMDKVVTMKRVYRSKIGWFVRFAQQQVQLSATQQRPYRQSLTVGQHALLLGQQRERQPLHQRLFENQESQTGAEPHLNRGY